MWGCGGGGNCINPSPTWSDLWFKIGPDLGWTMRRRTGLFVAFPHIGFCCRGTFHVESYHVLCLFLFYMDVWKFNFFSVKHFGFNMI